METNGILSSHNSNREAEAQRGDMTRLGFPNSPVGWLEWQLTSSNFPVGSLCHLYLHKIKSEVSFPRILQERFSHYSRKYWYLSSGLALKRVALEHGLPGTRTIDPRLPIPPQFQLFCLGSQLALMQAPGPATERFWMWFPKPPEPSANSLLFFNLFIAFFFFFPLRAVPTA